MSLTRIERDTLGTVEVPVDRLWGAQTQRSLAHFRISGERMPAEILDALALVKRECAKANAELGQLDKRLARGIVRAADEVLAGDAPQLVAAGEPAAPRGQP